MADEKTSTARGGIGFAGLLTIIFIILKLNPGATAEAPGPLTTAVASWPWWEWWGVSVFCPIIWSFYAVIGVFALVLVIALIAVTVKALIDR